MVVALFIAVIGYAQGHFTGSGIRNRFPRRKLFYSFVVLILVGIFILGGLIKLHGVLEPDNSVGLRDIIGTNILDFNNLKTKTILNDPASLLSIVLPLAVILVSRLARIRGSTKWFVNVLSGCAFLFVIAVNLNIEIPETGLKLYTVYQMSLLTGCVLGSDSIGRARRIARAI